MIIIVTGSRNYKEQLAVFNTLNAVNDNYGIDVLLTGKCPKGADTFAENWAVQTGIQLVLLPANWRGPHKAMAGFARNGLMLDIGVFLAQPNKPRILAFVSKCIKPNCQQKRTHWSHGTKDCWDNATALGIKGKYFEDHTLSTYQ